MTAGADGLVLTGVSKHFGGLAALDGVNFTARAGEVHAVLGQNGSGKSTLVKILTGVHTPDPGARMRLWGREVSLPIRAPQDHGIAVIHQDLGLVDGMTVLENVGVASGYGAALVAPIRMKSERARCLALLTELGLHTSPDARVSELSPASRAGIAIARAIRLLQGRSERFVFVLDEPTAYLNEHDADQVLALMRTMADRGSVVIFISHRLREVAAVADHVTVLRDGRVVTHFTGNGIDDRQVVTSMLGRDLTHYYPPRPTPPLSPAMLRVRDLSGPGFDSLSFTARPGEVIGFTGLVGMGWESVPYVLAGATPGMGHGSVDLSGVELTTLPLRERVRRGVVLVPGNRQRDGAWPAATASENIHLPVTTKKSSWRPIRFGSEYQVAAKLMRTLGVYPETPQYRVGQFSGGNQQKIVLAKWLKSDPKVLLLDEPTQGIDAGAKFEILKLITEQVSNGATALIFSSEYEQLAAVCNRVIILYRGSVVAQFEGEAIDASDIAAAAQMSTIPPSVF